LKPSSIQVREAVDGPLVEIVPMVPLDEGWPRLARDEVELWILDRAFLESQRAACLACLSAGERARSDRLARPIDQLRWALFHGAVRRILAGYLGADPATLLFERSPKGKPRWASSSGESPMDFNLSHSGDLMALACRSTGDIGVDVEVTDHRTDVQALAARFFHPNEGAAMMAGPEGPARALFFQWWTAKEALLKCRGEGLTDHLDTLDFSDWTAAGWACIESPPRPPSLAWRFGAGEAWTGTLVTVAPVSRVKLRSAAHSRAAQ